MDAETIFWLIIFGFVIYTALTDPTFRAVCVARARDLLDHRGRTQAMIDEMRAERAAEPEIALDEIADDPRLLLLAARLIALNDGKPTSLNAIVERGFGVKRGGGSKRYHQLTQSIASLVEAIKVGRDPIIRYDDKTPVRLDLRTGEEYVVDPQTRARHNVARNNVT